MNQQTLSRKYHKRSLPESSGGGQMLRAFLKGIVVKAKPEKQNKNLKNKKKIKKFQNSS